MWPKHIYKHVEHHGKLNFWEVKVDKPNSLKQKKEKFRRFFGLKAPLHKKMKF